jgi:hypothetical protein
LKARCHKAAFSEFAAKREITLRVRRGKPTRPAIPSHAAYCFICGGWHVARDEKNRERV